MAGSWYREGLFSSLSYATNGKVIRIPGSRKFMAKNSFYGQLLIKNLSKKTNEVLRSRLPEAVNQFMELDLASPNVNVPWKSGNLHDSIAAAITYFDESGRLLIVGGKAITAPRVATKPQTWGLSLGGEERDEHTFIYKSRREVGHYRGWGYKYAAKFTKAVKQSEDFPLQDSSNVVIYLEATIPYAQVLNDGIWNGWFDNLGALFADKMRQNVNISVNEIANFSSSDFGIGAQIGF